MAVQADSKAVIGGGFNSFNNTNINYIARLNGDTSLTTNLQFMSSQLFFGMNLSGVVSNTYFFEFEKHEAIGEHPTMAKLTYDPFPDAKMEDVVRREIIGRKLVLYVKLESDDFLSATQIRPGNALDYQGHKFAVESSVINSKPNPDGATVGAIVDVVGSEFLTEIEPMKVLAKLREIWAASNPK